MRLDANPETLATQDPGTVLQRQRERLERELSKCYDRAAEAIRPRRLHLADLARRSALQVADAAPGAVIPQILKDEARARGLPSEAYVQLLRKAVEESDRLAATLDAERQRGEGRLKAAGTSQELARIGAEIRATMARF